MVAALAGAHRSLVAGRVAALAGRLLELPLAGVASSGQALAAEDRLPKREGLNALGLVAKWYC